MSRPSSCVCFAAASCVSLMPASPSSSPRSSLVRVLSYAGYALRFSSLTPKHLAWSFVRPDFQYSTARFDAEVAGDGEGRALSEHLLGFVGPGRYIGVAVGNPERDKFVYRPKAPSH